jgi:hypothetical protein
VFNTTYKAGTFPSRIEASSLQEKSKDKELAALRKET